MIDFRVRRSKRLIGNDEVDEILALEKSQDVTQGPMLGVVTTPRIDDETSKSVSHYMLVPLLAEQYPSIYDIPPHQETVGECLLR